MDKHLDKASHFGKDCIFIAVGGGGGTGILLRGFLGTRLKLRCLLRGDQEMAASL